WRDEDHLHDPAREDDGRLRDREIRIVVDRGSLSVVRETGDQRPRPTDDDQRTTNMQRHFDRDIEEIKDLLLRMGAMVEDSIAQSIRALLDRDTSMAEEVIARDDEVDKMENLIDEKTLEL